MRRSAANCGVIAHPPATATVPTTLANVPRAYTYAAAGRLTKAQISGTKDTSFEYGYGNQNQSCGGGYADAGKDSLRTSGMRGTQAFFTCYNDRGQTTSTTDPLLTAGTGTAKIDHDGMGRVTRIGGSQPVELTWVGQTQLAKIVEKATSSPTSETTTTLILSVFGWGPQGINLLRPAVIGVLARLNEAPLASPERTPHKEFVDVAAVWGSTRRRICRINIWSGETDSADIAQRIQNRAKPWARASRCG